MKTPIVLVLCLQLGWAGQAVMATDMSEYRSHAVLADVNLVDQYGHRHQLPQLTHNKIVLINFAYSRCQTICPLFSVVMQRIARLLNDVPPEQVLLLTVSVDPEHDQGTQLVEQANKYEAKGNWLWLTGNPEDIRSLSRGFGISLQDGPQQHPPELWLSAHQQWYRWVGIPNAQTVAQVVHDFLPKVK